MGSTLLAAYIPLSYTPPGSSAQLLSLLLPNLSFIHLSIKSHAIVTLFLYNETSFDLICSPIDIIHWFGIYFWTQGFSFCLVRANRSVCYLQ